jgi:hypothetical protein
MNSVVVKDQYYQTRKSRIDNEIKKTALQHYHTVINDDYTQLKIRFTENTEYSFEINIPDNYPYNNNVPKVLMTSPENKEIYTEIFSWGPTKNLYSFIQEIIQNNPKFLILGAYPDASYGHGNRNIYNKEEYYILDIIDPKASNTFNSRYIQADFTDKDSLQKVSGNYQKKFDIILFDWSTYKFFNKDDKTFEERLGYILNMLKNSGTLYIESPGGETASNDEQAFFINFLKKNLEKINYSYKEAILENIHNSRIINEVYKSIIPIKNQSSYKIAIVKNNKISGGKRTKKEKTKTNKRKTQKRRRH